MSLSKFISNPARCLLITGLLTATPFSSPAQLPNLQDIISGETEQDSQTPETPEETRSRLQEWIGQAQTSLDSMSAPDALSSLPKEITPEEHLKFRRRLEQMVLAAMQSIKDINDNEDAQKAFGNARARNSNWKGFSDPPPYSILMIDDLLNDQQATRDKLASYKASRLNYKNLLDSSLKESKTAENAVGKIIIQLQRAGQEAHEATKWRLEAARLTSRLYAIRSNLMNTDIEILENRIKTAKINLSLLHRKIAEAKKNSHLDQNDLAEIAKKLNEYTNKFRAEAQAKTQQIKAAQPIRDAAQKELETLNNSKANPDALHLTKAKFELENSRISALQTTVEALNGLTHLKGIVIEAYQERAKILNHPDGDSHKQSLEFLRATAKRLLAWENLIKNIASANTADLDKLESRLSALPTGDPVIPILIDERSTPRLSQAFVTPATPSPANEN